MSANELLESLPDLILLLRRDGTLMGSYGGRGVPGLKPIADVVGKRLDAVWPAPLAGLIKRLTREAIARRATTETPFQHAGRSYDARISSLGSERAICVIRPILDDPQNHAHEAHEGNGGQLHRRGLLKCLSNSLSVAALRGTPATVAVIHMDGLSDIKQIISGEVSEQILRQAGLRLAPSHNDCAQGAPWCYLGQFSDNLLLLVLPTADRDAIETSIAQISGKLRQPVSVGDALFQLTPYAGVAILGQDASAPKVLLDRARGAAVAAGRSGSSSVRFVSDNSRLRTMARLDIVDELRKAISNRDISLRYVGRHDLASGRLVACVGYLRWRHELYGDVHPLEFMRLAEITGLASDLVRTALNCLRKDFAAFAPQWDAGVRISFGVPRHHVLHENFISDVERFLAEGVVPAERLELRISVKAAGSRAPTDFNSLARRGVQLVVDDMGRGMDLPLDWLAHAPVRGLQINRGWESAMRSDTTALRMCRAGVGVAAALGLVSIATAVDEPVQRDALLALGCQHGSGDLYRDELVPSDIIGSSRAAAAA